MNKSKQICRNGPDCKWLKDGVCSFSHEKQKTAEEQRIDDHKNLMKAAGEMAMEGEELAEFCYLVDRGCLDHVLMSRIYIADAKKEAIRNEKRKEKLNST